MNFHDLMAKAAENQESKKAQVTAVKRYNTEIPRAKKEVRQKGISPNVLAFLAKKEEEAKKKVVEQKKLREKYLQKSKQCYRKEQNIHELMKEEDGTTAESVEPSLPKLNAKAAEEANSRFQGNSKTSSSSKAPSNSQTPSKTNAKQEKADTAKKKRLGNAPSFAELMKMAAEGKKSESSKKEHVRPMTAKEKEELDRTQAFKKSKEYRIWAEYGPAALEKYKAQQRLKEDGASNSPNSEKSSASPKPGAKRASDSKPAPTAGKGGPAKKGKTAVKSEPPPPKAPKYDSTNENVLVCRPAQAATSVWDRVYNHSRQPPMRGRQVSDSDESEESDYDDEDGFIDDGPLEDPYGSNISQHIRSIFGYDKRKFRDEDDDVSNMETSFAQQMMEEKRSARLGLKEDLEDIRREEEEKRQKLAMKKKAKR